MNPKDTSAIFYYKKTMDHIVQIVLYNTDLVNHKMVMFKIHCRFFFPAGFFPFKDIQSVNSIFLENDQIRQVLL